MWKLLKIMYRMKASSSEKPISKARRPQVRLTSIFFKSRGISSGMVIRSQRISSEEHIDQTSCHLPVPAGVSTPMACFGLIRLHTGALREGGLGVSYMGPSTLRLSMKGSSEGGQLEKKKTQSPRAFPCHSGCVYPEAGSRKGHCGLLSAW